MLLLMYGLGIAELIIIFLILLSWVPCVLVLFSKKAQGQDKIIWFLLSFFLSWFGYLIFYFVHIRSKNKQNVS